MDKSTNISCPSAFTVDVEDGVSIAMRDVFNVESSQTDRVVTNTKKILDLLEQHATKGTFFILGKVAEDFPELIKSIGSAGHEIAVHGYHHFQFFRLTPLQAKEELSRAKNLLEDITGKAVIGHRAPAFSVTPKTAWALDVIAECGFTYDSSIMPVAGGRYGWPSFPKSLTKITTADGNELLEIALPTVNLLGYEIPFSGGGYLRLFPFFFTKHSFTKHSKIRPTILYIHPYELDNTRYPEYYFDALKKLSFIKQLKMRSNWLNRGTVPGKLDQLLSVHTFIPMKQLIDYEIEKGNQGILLLK